MHLLTQLIKDEKLTNIIGKGTFSVVTQHTGCSVLKYSVCPAYNNFINLPCENTVDEPYFIKGVYEGSFYINDHLVTVHELPLLNSFHIKDLNKDQKKFVHNWKKLCKEYHYLYVQFTYHKDTGKFMRKAEALINDIFKSMSDNFRINVINLIRSMEPRHILDNQFKGNMLMDDQGQLVITDPVFCKDTLFKLKGYS